MFLSAILAGSFFPFSSEAIILALLAMGLRPTPLLICATVGNTLGTMLNYYIGRLGKMEWIERYLRVSPERLEQARRFLGGRGSFMAIFTFLPIIGTAIAIVLGLMRANPWATLFFTTIGKFIRYAIIVLGAMKIF